MTSNKSKPNDAPNTGEAAADVGRFAALLEESRGIKGVSLWQDAWRRLRKNLAAMVSLCLLTAIGLLALLTPLLPLQSPLDKDLKQRLFLPPNLEAVKLGSREGLGFEENSLVAQLGKFERDSLELRDKIRKANQDARKALQHELDVAAELRAAKSDQATALQTQLDAATETRRQMVDKRERAENELASHLPKHPFEQLWSKPGWMTSALIRIRLALFGDWCIPSICGTDSLGRDILARVFWGARVSLIVGIVATMVSLIIGVSYGATAGYIGGLVDDVMMRIVDILYSIPFIFVVIFIITILKAEETKAYMDSLGIDQIMVFYVIIGAIYWLTMARVVRGQVISLKNEQFVEAARTIGASQTRIIFRHLIPNVMGIVIVYLTLTIPSVMLFEAFLSFLGLGVEAPDVSWGLLVNEGIKVITPIKTYWWLVLFPGLTLTLTLLGLNFLGDGLRDALDPRLKNR